MYKIKGDDKANFVSVLARCSISTTDQPDNNTLVKV